MTNSSVDVLIIGAGQAGLAMGHLLQRAGYTFQIVDRNARVGDSWRRRYDSLVLFTPRAYSALPGLPVPGDQEGYPTKDEIGDYLERYARHFDLPIALGTGIRNLARAGDDFRAETDGGERMDARAVVLATGAFQMPAIPPIAREFSAEVAHITPESYKCPAQVAPGSVLVVGDGATGRQIALELAGNHEVFLATGRARRVSPERILGRNAFWWMDRLGLLRASRETPVGRFLLRADPFPGKHLGLRRLQKQGVRVVGRLRQAEERRATFATGETAEIETVLWATGYRDESEWVEIAEAKDARGTFVHQRGVSPVPGLYFIGRSWQWTRGSALLAGVGNDARYLLAHLARHIPDGQTARLRGAEEAVLDRRA